MRAFLIGFSGVIGLVLLTAFLAPEGEVVTLHSVDAEGRPYESALWIVEIDGAGLHLRSGNPESGWLGRLTLHPRVELERGGETRPFRAVRVEDAGIRRAVNAAMAEKYGLADRLVRSRVDVERSVPVRLDLLEGADAAPFH